MEVQFPKIEKTEGGDETVEEQGGRGGGNEAFVLGMLIPRQLLDLQLQHPRSSLGSRCGAQGAVCAGRQSHTDGVESHKPDEITEGGDQVEKRPKTELWVSCLMLLKCCCV